MPGTLYDQLEKERQEKLQQLNEQRAETDRGHKESFHRYYSTRNGSINANGERTTEGTRPQQDRERKVVRDKEDERRKRNRTNYEGTFENWNDHYEKKLIPRQTKDDEQQQLQQQEYNSLQQEWESYDQAVRKAHKDYHTARSKEYDECDANAFNDYTSKCNEAEQKFPRNLSDFREKHSVSQEAHDAEYTTAKQLLQVEREHTDTEDQTTLSRYEQSVSAYNVTYFSEVAKQRRADIESSEEYWQTARNHRGNFLEKVNTELNNILNLEQPRYVAMLNSINYRSIGVLEQCKDNFFKHAREFIDQGVEVIKDIAIMPTDVIDSNKKFFNVINQLSFDAWKYIFEVIKGEIAKFKLLNEYIGDAKEIIRKLHGGYVAYVLDINNYFHNVWQENINEINRFLQEEYPNLRSLHPAFHIDKAQREESYKNHADYIKDFFKTRNENRETQLKERENNRQSADTKSRNDWDIFVSQRDQKRDSYVKSIHNEYDKIYHKYYDDIECLNEDTQKNPSNNNNNARLIKDLEQSLIIRKKWHYILDSLRNGFYAIEDFFSIVPAMSYVTGKWLGRKLVDLTSLIRFHTGSGAYFVELFTYNVLKPLYYGFIDVGTVVARISKNLALNAADISIFTARFLTKQLIYKPSIVIGFALTHAITGGVYAISLGATTIASKVFLFGAALYSFVGVPVVNILIGIEFEIIERSLQIASHLLLSLYKVAGCLIFAPIKAIGKFLLNNIFNLGLTMIYTIWCSVEHLYNLLKNIAIRSLVIAGKCCSFLCGKFANIMEFCARNIGNGLRWTKIILAGAGHLAKVVLFDHLSYPIWKISNKGVTYIARGISNILGAVNYKLAKFSSHLYANLQVLGLHVEYAVDRIASSAWYYMKKVASVVNRNASYAREAVTYNVNIATMPMRKTLYNAAINMTNITKRCFTALSRSIDDYVVYPAIYLYQRVNQTIGFKIGDATVTGARYAQDVCTAGIRAVHDVEHVAGEKISEQFTSAGRTVQDAAINVSDNLIWMCYRTYDGLHNLNPASYKERKAQAAVELLRRNNPARN